MTAAEDPATCMFEPTAHRANFGQNAIGDTDRVTRLLRYHVFSQDIEVSFRETLDFAQLMPSTVFKIEV